MIATLGLLVGLGSLPGVLAHVPETGSGGASREAATPIENTQKSWAFYGSISHSREVAYYEFQAEPGREIWFQLLGSPADSGFAAAVFAIGPGVPVLDSAPSAVEVREGEGVQRFRAAESPQRMYEPFAPSAMVDLGQWTLTPSAGGVHYFVVVPEAGPGRYALAVGLQESFSAAEWVLVPYSTLKVYQWAGQPWWIVALPALVVAAVAAGLGMSAWRGRRVRLSPLHVGTAIAGVLFLAGAATFLTQAVVGAVQSSWEPMILVSFVFVALGASLGVVLVLLGVRPRRSSRQVRAFLVGASVVGFAATLGYLVGPAVALVASLLPARRTWNVGHPEGGR